MAWLVRNDMKTLLAAAALAITDPQRCGNAGSRCMRPRLVFGAIRLRPTRQVSPCSLCAPLVTRLTASGRTRCRE
jgi:hypothetical protein